MATHKHANELADSIDKFDMVNLVLDYTFDRKQKINAAKRLRMPTVADRVTACRYSIEMFDDEIIDVIIAGIASTVLQFGIGHTDDKGKMTLTQATSLPTDFIIDHFDYTDLVRVNALMGKNIKQPHSKKVIEAALKCDIMPLSQTYIYKEMGFDAAFRLRRPVVRDHIEARGFSKERWGHAFSDVIIAGTAANTMAFGTLSEIDGKPTLINQLNVPIDFIIDNFIYPDLMQLNQLLAKSPASSVSEAKP